MNEKEDDVMTEPKEYKLKENITGKQLRKAGFTEREDDYSYKRFLYGNYVYLKLLIDPTDNCMIVNVSTDDGCPYVPFYDINRRHNNNVYEVAVKNYNVFMDSLVAINILEYDTKPEVFDYKEIKIKYHSDIERLEKLSVGDWIDLRVAEDTFIPVNTYKLVSLGVSMWLPEGYEAHIVPRSSTFKNFGVIQCNHMGIIDSSYNGSYDIWKFPAYCIEPKTTMNGIAGTLLHKNDRICQFRIIKNQEKIKFIECNELNDTDRGGIGSTGKN